MRAAESADATDLSENLSARRETGGVELLKFGEPCNVAISSQAFRRLLRREGAETRRAAPEPEQNPAGEGIVQTPNLGLDSQGRRKP